IRTPRAILTLSSRSRLTTAQISSPRYFASLQPGGFARVRPGWGHTLPLGNQRWAAVLTPRRRGALARAGSRRGPGAGSRARARGFDELEAVAERISHVETAAHLEPVRL